MTSPIERLAADLGYTGEAWIRDTVTTANGELLAIPASWRGKFVNVTVVGGATVFLRLGTDNTVQVDGTTVSSKNGSGVVTAGGKEPHVIVAAGMDIPVRISTTQTHLAHVASATGSKLHIRLATGDGVYP